MDLPLRARQGWKALASGQLRAVLIALLIAYLVAGQLALGWVAAQRTGVSVEVLGWLTRAGLLDVGHAKAFIFGLFVLSLNLVLAVLDSLPEIFGSAWNASEGGLMRSEFETRLSKEAFLAMAGPWGRERLGRKPHRTTAGPVAGVILAAKRGRLTRLMRAGSRLSLAWTLLAGVWVSQHEFQARTWIEEAGIAQAFEVVRGEPPAGWSAFADAQAPAAQYARPRGYMQGPFRMARASSQGTRQDATTFLRFFEGPKLVASLLVAQGRPARLVSGGLRYDVHLRGYDLASSQSVNLAIVDRSGTERTFDGLSKDREVELEEFRFKVTEIEPKTSSGSAAAQISFQPGHKDQGAKREAFWIFADHPDYDFAHRRVSSQHFVLNGLKQRSSAEILVGRLPGGWAVVAGLAALALLTWLANLRPEQRYWIRWVDHGGSNELNGVELIGWSPTPRMFEPQFYDLADSLERRIERTEAGGHA